MTRVREVIEKMVELSNDNISDPVTQRANDNGTWIFDHFPKYGKGNQLPRIGFHKVTTGHGQYRIGDITARTDTDIQASIMVRKDKYYDFDNDGNNEPGEDLADFLHQKVKDVIEDNQSQLTGLGDDVAYVKTISSDTVKPENKNFILEALNFELKKYS